MCDKVDNKQKKVKCNKIQKYSNKIKKGKCGSLDNYEKEQLKNRKEKRKNVC